MTDQDMRNAIDSEFDAFRVANTKIIPNGPCAAETICAHIAYTNGLRFVRTMIVKPQSSYVSSFYFRRYHD